VREIKFRLWDRNRKKMIFGPTDDNPNASWVLAAASLSKCEPMQFTGLKDKNGKEIYSGDIVSLSKDTWFAKRPMIEAVEITNYKIKPFEADVNPWHIPSEEWEVIGNIHENPELLK
jgi:hypothetical protein